MYYGWFEIFNFNSNNILEGKTQEIIICFSHNIAYPSPSRGLNYLFYYFVMTQIFSIVINKC